MEVYSLETLTLKANEHDQLMDNLADKHDALDKKFDGYVTYATFTWTLGVLMVIVIGLFGVIYTRIEKVSDVTTKTQDSVSYIQGRLQDAQVTR